MRVKKAVCPPFWVRTHPDAKQGEVCLPGEFSSRTFAEIRWKTKRPVGSVFLSNGHMNPRIRFAVLVEESELRRAGFQLQFPNK